MEEAREGGEVGWGSEGWVGWLTEKPWEEAVGRREGAATVGGCRRSSEAVGGRMRDERETQEKVSIYLISPAVGITH